MDQRHGHDAASMVAAAQPDRRDLQRAALLHDIGKRHARLGIVGRSLASASHKLHLPSTKAAQVYLNHGRTGALELVAADAEPLVVAFAETHHGVRPSGFAAADWSILQAADEGTKPPRD